MVKGKTNLQKHGPRNPSLKRAKFSQTGKRKDIDRDRQRFSVAPGYRRSKNGLWYYEGRMNRSDIPGTRL